MDATFGIERDRKGETMPQIMVTAVRGDAQAEGSVMMCERVNVDDFESDRFAALLVERLGWAVSDADEVEQRTSAQANVDSP